MAGSRPLTKSEERLLVRRTRRINARDRALITAQLFLGFRISEILALTVGHVLVEGRIRPRVALPPRFLKGKRGTTRTVPVGPELQRALEHYLTRRARWEDLRPEAPLFLSPRKDPDGAPQPICRSMAEKIIRKALRGLGTDPQGLSTHSLRKSWAGRLYEASNHDILVVRDGLGHSSVSVIQVYLPTSGTRVEEFIRRSDWTRSRKGVAAKTAVARTGSMAA
jgi:integrase